MKKYKYVTIEIEQDSDANNPRDEFDNLSTFYSPYKSRYICGGKNDARVNDWELSAYKKEYQREGAVIVPFTCDAGECFAVIERKKIINEYGNDSRSSLYHARQCAKGEIEEFLNWCNGEVYGYIITSNETGETLDSCWGFYGLEFCQQESESQADYFENELKQAEELTDSRLSEVTR